MVIKIFFLEFNESGHRMKSSYLHLIMLMDAYEEQEKGNYINQTLRFRLGLSVGNLHLTRCRMKEGDISVESTIEWSKVLDEDIPLTPPTPDAALFTQLSPAASRWQQLALTVAAAAPVTAA